VVGWLETEGKMREMERIKISSIMMLMADKEMHLCMVLLVLLLVVYQNSICEQNYLSIKPLLTQKCLHGNTSWIMAIHHHFY
jgi:hypothetical protein